MRAAGVEKRGTWPTDAARWTVMPCSPSRVHFGEAANRGSSDEHGRAVNAKGRRHNLAGPQRARFIVDGLFELLQGRETHTYAAVTSENMGDNDAVREERRELARERATPIVLALIRPRPGLGERPRGFRDFAGPKAVFDTRPVSETRLGR
jgi:hypothetical protein